MQKIAFFFSFFPRKTELFIHNKLFILKERGLDITLFSIIGSSDAWVGDKRLKALLKNHFHALGYLVYLKGLLYALCEPITFLQHIRWIFGLNHKNQLARFRVTSALLVAYGIRQVIIKEKFTYFHAHFASYPTEIVMCLSRLTGIPYGATWHAFDIWKDHNILPEKIRYAAKIILNNRYNFEYVKRLSDDKDKLHLMYNDIDFENFPKSIPRPLKGPLLAVGRLVPKKGFSYLIEAVAKLRDQGLMVELNIVGSPEPFIDRLVSGEGSELNRLRKKIRSLKLENQVFLKGHLPHSSVLQMLNGSSMLIMPCIQDQHNNIDGIPNVILEAMAMKRPVVASRLAGIPEVIKEGETGLLVEPKDVEGLTQAIAYLINNHERADQLAGCAYEFIAETFEVNKNKSRVLNLFS